MCIVYAHPIKGDANRTKQWLNKRKCFISTKVVNNIHLFTGLINLVSASSGKVDLIPFKTFNIPFLT